MLKKLLIYCLFIALSLSGSVFAAELSEQGQAPLYKVELIVFAHVTARGLLSEQWPVNPTLPSMQRVYNLQAPTQPGAALNGTSTATIPTQPEPYQILPTSFLQLQTIAAKLNAKDNYPVLVHVAWLQPGLPIRNSRRIHIYGGQAYGASEKPLTDVSPLNVDASDAALPLPNSTDQWQLNGYVRVSKPYLFELQANLVLTIPQQLLRKVSFRVARQVNVHQFILQQTFRMRLGKLYYIDHPLFGILAEITKYTANNKQGS